MNIEIAEISILVSNVSIICKFRTYQRPFAFEASLRQSYRIRRRKNTNVSFQFYSSRIRIDRRTNRIEILRKGKEYSVSFKYFLVSTFS